MMILMHDCVRLRMGGGSVLLITRVTSLGVPQINRMLQNAAKVIPGRLYVLLHSTVINNLANDSSKLFLFVRRLYLGASVGTLDVRLLLTNMKSNGVVDSKITEGRDKLLVDYDTKISAWQNAEPILDKINVLEDNVTLWENEDDFFVASPKYFTAGKYAGVVLGGTFDRLHVGHKILLSTAALVSHTQLTCGVTEGPMLKGKCLQCLIEPLDTRIGAVVEFVKDVDPSLSCKVVPIDDPFGPSIVDTNLHVIVASEETVKGAHSVNKRRLIASLNELDVFIIGTVSGVKTDHHKISSSDTRLQIALDSRRDIFGTLIKPPVEVDLRRTPYIIGLTGGIASGKSRMSTYLADKGAKVIDCDKLGHSAYLKGAKAFEQIREHFGEKVVNKTTGEIDRKELGAMVFDNKENMNKLNEIVWPAIKNMVNKQIEQLAKESVKVVILEAAVLIDAKWHNFCHEVWVAVIPREEAISRIHIRNNLSTDQVEGLGMMEVDDLAQQADEIQVLRSIYDEDVMCDDQLTNVSINIVVGDMSAQLTARLPCDYPSISSPVLELSCPHLNPSQRRRAENVLITVCGDLRGMPVLYECVLSLNTCLEQMSCETTDTTQEEQTEAETSFESESPANQTSAQIIKCPVIHSGDSITDRKSAFQAHCAALECAKQVRIVLETLKSSSKIARATHNIVAWKFGNAQDCEDDGEHNAGSRLLHLLHLLGCHNIIVVVSRWYGGIHLGPDRFKHICNVARDIIVANRLSPKVNPNPSLPSKSTTSNKRIRR